MDYPKMLYKGDTKHYQHVIAGDEEHEVTLKEVGYADFADLEVWTGLGSVGGEELSKNSTTVDELSQNVADLELQLSVAQTERDENIAEVKRLNGIIERGKAENEELRKRVDELTAPADAVPPKTTQTKAK